MELPFPILQPGEDEKTKRKRFQNHQTCKNFLWAFDLLPLAKAGRGQIPKTPTDNQVLTKKAQGVEIFPRLVLFIICILLSSRPVLLVLSTTDLDGLRRDCNAD